MKRDDNNGTGSWDVLCVGNAAWDITLRLDHQPADDEKVEAGEMWVGGGGPAANAAVACARLGLSSAFAGYLSRDPFGRAHRDELVSEGVDLALVSEGDAPMRVSTIYVKPDGRRSIVHRAPAVDQGDPTLPATVDWNARVVLFDGYQPRLSAAVLEEIERKRQGRRVGTGDRPRAGTPDPPAPSASPAAETVTVLDAGSVREGTRLLASRVDHLVASWTFARDFTGRSEPGAAVEALSRVAPVAVVTLGEEGLVWARRDDSRAHALPAMEVSPVVDTTGAGDAFHAGYCAGLAWGLPFDEILDLARACGAAACTRLGARPSLPGRRRLSGLTLLGDGFEDSREDPGHPRDQQERNSF